MFWQKRFSNQSRTIKFFHDLSNIYNVTCKASHTRSSHHLSCQEYLLLPYFRWQDPHILTFWACLFTSLKSNLPLNCYVAVVGGLNWKLFFVENTSPYKLKHLTSPYNSQSCVCVCFVQFMLLSCPAFIVLSSFYCPATIWPKPALSFKFKTAQPSFKGEKGSPGVPSWKMSKSAWVIERVMTVI